MTRPPSKLLPETLLVHQQWLRELARSLVTGADQADEVAQRTWLAALERPPREASNLKHWLAVVARNVARKLHRGDVRRRGHEVEGGRSSSGTEEAVPSAIELVARAEAQRRVVDAVLGLEEPYRSAILYRYFEELSPAAIAQITGDNVDTVKTRLKRGREKLRERFAREMGEEGGLPWQLAVAPLLTLPTGGNPVGPVTAGSGTATAAAEATATLLGGILAMTKTKFAAAAVIAAIVMGMAWFSWREPSRGARDENRRPSSSTAAAATAAEPVEGPSPVERVASNAIAPEDHSIEPSTTPEAPIVCSLVGVVVDSNGTPVEGAVVFLGRREDDGFHTQEEFLSRLGDPLHGLIAPKASSGRTTTDASGTFAFPVADDLPEWTLGAVHPEIGIGFVASIRIPAGARAQQVDIALARGTTLSGRIFDPEGNLVPRATVELEALLENGDPHARPRSIGRVTADEQGEFRTLPLPYPAFELTASESAAFRERRSIPTRSGIIRSEGAEVQRVDVTLLPIVTLHGRLLAPDGGPARLNERLLPFLTPSERSRQRMENFEICAVNADPGEALGLIPRSDPQQPDSYGFLWGRIDVEHDTYTLDLVDDFPTHLAFVCRNHVLGMCELVPGVTEFDIVVDLAELPTRLPRGRLALQVIRSDGAPVTSGHVGGAYVWREGKLVKEMHLYDELGRDGTLDIELPASECTVEISLPGFTSPRSPVRIKDGEVTSLTLELKPVVGSLRGVVLGQDGKPRSGTFVRACLLDADGWSSLVVPNRRTDANGAFELTALPDGPITLIANDEQGAPAVVVFDELPDGVVTLELHSGVRVTLDAHSADGAALGPIRWRIFDNEGIAVIDGMNPGPANSFHEADQQPFELAPGDYDAECWAAGYLPARARLHATQGATLSVTLAPVGG